MGPSGRDIVIPHPDKEGNIMELSKSNSVVKHAYKKGYYVINGDVISPFRVKPLALKGTLHYILNTKYQTKVIERKGEKLW